MRNSQFNHDRIVVILLALAITCAGRAVAQDPASSMSATPSGSAVVETPTTAPIKLLTNYVEAGGDYLALSNGYGFWRGGYARGVWNMGRNTWNAEVSGQQEFGDAGTYFALGDTHIFNADWYSSVTVGSSGGGFFWPRFRSDAFLNKKWEGRKQFITSVGFAYYAAKDVHRDYGFSLGSTYYFEKPWIIEDGIRFNLSHPGSVFSPSGFVAVTEGRNKRHYLTVRAGFGEEAYQLVGPRNDLTDFTSQTLTITWRQWAGRSWGFNFVGDYYHSPYYTRGGSTVGIFKEF